SLVAQNTHGVRDIHVPPTEFLTAQLQAVSDDVVIDALKTGMLGTVEIIETVAVWLDDQPPTVLVVDPVMVATSGDRLVDQQAEQAMIEFCARATVVTPNIDELAVLTGSEPARDGAQALNPAAAWAGHDGVLLVVLTALCFSPSTPKPRVSPDVARHPVYAARLRSARPHGTGCSLSAALATRLGAGDSPGTALSWATQWLHEAIKHGEALHVGSGHGPVDHSYRARKLQGWTIEAPSDEAAQPTAVKGGS